MVLWCAIGTWGLWAVVRLLGVELGFPLVAVIAYTPYAAVTAIVLVLGALALRRRPAGPIRSR